MALKAGIVGLPNVGKSTLFNALSNSQVEAANYPFATIEPNVGVVELQDERLTRIAKIAQPQKIIRSTFEFIDIAGLVAGASQGEGLGNKFLANIREVDAIVQVVRCFQNKDVIHVSNEVNPLADIEIINMELILADLETITNVLRRLTKQKQNSNDKYWILEYEVASKAKACLESEKVLRSLELSKAHKKILKSYNLLTIKPIIYVGNVSETMIANPSACPDFQKVLKYASQNQEQAIAVAAKLESELAQIDEGNDKQLFLSELGLKEPSLNKLVRITFNVLGLATFFTAGPKEVRSWTFKKGFLAPQCAGIIHTDFERGFIKAEVISYDDYIALGGEIAARRAGKIRLEGKNYVFQDGDITEFKFNV